MKRTLNLKRETLAELTPGDLLTVVGGAAQTNNGFTCPVVRCDIRLSDRLGCLPTADGCNTGNC